MAILTFVMFTVWALVRSFMNRPPGDYETEVCDMRLKDELYDQAIQAANTALEKTPNHRGAIMCKALVFISQKMYTEATEELNYLINFFEANLAYEQSYKAVYLIGIVIIPGIPIIPGNNNLPTTSSNRLLLLLLTTPLRGMS